MKPKHLCATLLLALTASCGGKPTTQTEPQSTDPVSRAIHMAEIYTSKGDILTASRYLEAALSMGGNEVEILPLLAAAQIRSGRLHAALGTIARLGVISPERPAVNNLHETVARMIGAGGTSLEVSP